MMEEQNPVVSAIFQVAHACTTRIDAIEDALLELCAELRERGAISDHVDHSSITCRISQIAAEVKAQGNGGPVYDLITQSAMTALTLREFATLEDAPEWVQKMCRGELRVQVAKPGEAGSFLGSEGPSL